MGGTYEPDEITINLLKDGEDSFTYKNGTITVNSGRLDIIDGWHRSSAILEAVVENPEIEMYFELRFVNFDIQKARDFIVQKNKQRKISEKHIQSLNVSDYHNSITRTLNESPKSDFRGKIVTTKHLINKGYGLVTFDIIANAIDANFDIKTRSQSEKIQEYLISFFNEIYGIYYNELNNRKGIYTEPFSFIGYVAIASVLYQNENWKTLLSDVLSRINFTTNNIFYQDIKDYQVNISKRNINRVSDYFKKMTEEGVK